jgi:hypothetical protein
MNACPVILDFKCDGEKLAEEIRSGLARASAAELEETRLLLPVRFAVGGQELLQIDSEARQFVAGETAATITQPAAAPVWLELPLLNIARLLAKAVEELKPGGVVTHPLPGGGNLLFLRSGDDVEVRSDINGRSGTASYLELQDAFREFSVRAESLLRANIME